MKTNVIHRQVKSNTSFPLSIKTMKLQSFEQTAAYHTKAADIAFTNGQVDAAVSHLKAAFYAVINNRAQYLLVVSNAMIERYDRQMEQIGKLKY